MGKQYLKRKLPDLILIEGFWNIGKTTLVNCVKKISKLVYIKEPDHLKDNVQKNISEWYEKRHKERIKVAAKNIEEGKKVIMERSLISNISYQYAMSGKILPRYISELKKIGTIDDVGIIFLYGSRNFIIKQSRDIKDTETRNLILKKEFYNRYLEFYQKILPKYIKTNLKIVKIIKVDKINGFKTLKNILNLFYRQFLLLKKEKVVCASIVAYHDNKILLLYDHKYKHYVLPQGHQEPGEKIKETATRETTEETGFNNLKVLKKIKKYQYHYSAEDRIIYKLIHVYLLKILSLSKVKKFFESHEKYSNEFFIFEDAVKKARWPQDRKVIEEAVKYIKSPRFQQEARTVDFSRDIATI